MMTTLFPQAMSDAWGEKELKKKWKNHIENHTVPMFIIWQDTESYRDVSDVISSAFHEIGHYCNGMTRTERNGDLIAIFSEEIAKSLVKKCMAISGVNFQMAQLALITSPVVQEFKECVYGPLKDYFRDVMQPYLDYPGTLFWSRFQDAVENLTELYADCDNEDLLGEGLSDKLLSDIKYMFCIEEEQDFTYKTVRQMVRNCKETLNHLKKETTIKLPLSTQKHIRNYIEAASQFCETIRTADTMILEDNDEEQYFLNSINRLEESLQGIDLKVYCRWDMGGQPSEEVCEIRETAELLQEIAEYVKMILKGLSVLSSQELLTCSGQEKNRTQIQNNIKLKRRLIQNIRDIYFENCQKLLFQNDFDDFAEVYQRMNLYPDSKRKNFEKMINQAIMGLKWSEDKLITVKACYEESIADVVMCVNLDLSVKEYFSKIRVVFNSYTENGKWSAARPVIVTGYLELKENIKQYSDKRLPQNDLHKRFEKIFNDLNEDGMEKNELREVLNCLENYSEILDSKLFRVTMCRIAQIADRVKFVEPEKFSFAKQSIGEKLSNKAKENTGLYVQQKELEFLLEYYYQNRSLYAREGAEEITEEENVNGNK